MTAANSAQDNLRQLSQELSQEHQHIKDMQKEIQLITSDLKSRSQLEISHKFKEYHLRLTTQLTDKLKDQMPQWKSDLAKTSETFRYWIEENMTRHLIPISEENGQRLSEYILNKALNSLSRVVHAFQDRLAKDIKNALNVEFAGANFDVKVEKPNQPDVRIGNVFMTPWEIIWFLIPMQLFSPLIYRHFINLIPWEAEKNLSRLSAQWNETISFSIDAIAQQTIDFILNEINTIENIIVKASDNRKGIEIAISEIGSIKEVKL